MAIKRVDLPDIGTVTLQKRRGNRSLRISINARGEVKVTLPPWAPYRMAAEFALARRSWIVKHRPSVPKIAPKTSVGKAHHMVFITSESLSRPRSRIKENEIQIFLPTNMSHQHEAAQKIADSAAVRALKQEAEQLLPNRLRHLALQHNFSYKSVSIKRLASRWGSCDSQGNITLNCYLMQLPWRLIDYVLLHELTHTRVMAHGKPFWQELGNYIPNLPEVRKEMRSTRPLLNF